MRTYEVMTIWRPELAETEVRTQVADMESMLRGNGAEVGETDFWGKRRFAYEIDHETEGYYTVVSFEGEPAAVQELERTLSLSDQVLRHKVMRPDS